MANPIITIQMKDGGVMKAELYPEIAPATVKNFVDLAAKGFYADLYQSQFEDSADGAC